MAAQYSSDDLYANSPKHCRMGHDVSCDIAHSTVGLDSKVQSSIKLKETDISDIDLSLSHAVQRAEGIEGDDKKKMKRRTKMKFWQRMR